MLRTVAQSLISVLILTAPLYGNSIDAKIAKVGEDFFYKQQASALLYSKSGNVTEYFSCNQSSGPTDSGEALSTLCLIGERAVVVDTMTWASRKKLQFVRVCLPCPDCKNSGIPIQTLKDAARDTTAYRDSAGWSGKSYYLGRVRGWFNDYDNIFDHLFRGNIQTACWTVKSTKE